MSDTSRIPDRPMPADASLLWFVLVVQPRQEQGVTDDLRDAGLRPYLPKYTVRRKPFHGRKRVDVKRPLLPGYLLLGVDLRFVEPRFNGWALIRGADGVRGILGTVARGADGRTVRVPLRVPWWEIETIQIAEDMGLFNDAGSHLTIGEEVMVLEGPFADFRGPVTAFREGRLVMDTPIGFLALTVEQVRRVA